MKIEFDHIFKSFGKTEVLHDVSFSVQDGQILALLGENGAGKSPPVSGQVVIDGQPVHLHSPNESIDHGIAFIHQELSPVNDLRVYENMFLGREERNAFGWLNRESMRAQARKILDSLGIAIDEHGRDPVYADLLPPFPDMVPLPVRAADMRTFRCPGSCPGSRLG